MTDFALVAETDLDLDVVRDILWRALADGRLEVIPGDGEGSAEVTGIPGEPDIPELGGSAEA